MSARSAAEAAAGVVLSAAVLWALGLVLKVVYIAGYRAAMDDVARSRRAAAGIGGMEEYR